MQPTLRNLFVKAFPKKLRIGNVEKEETNLPQL